MSTILLDEEKGLNPHLTYCPRCGGESNGIVLLGRKDSVSSCSVCGAKHIGKKSGGCEATDGCSGNLIFERRLDDHEKLPGELCADCQKESAEMQAIVESGGVYWRCVDCGAGGALKPGHTADAVRRESGIAAPDPVGIELSKNNCQNCGNKEAVNES